MLRGGGTVITSYSIHYTKLYEGTGGHLYRMLEMEADPPLPSEPKEEAAEDLIEEEEETGRNNFV